MCGHNAAMDATAIASVRGELTDQVLTGPDDFDAFWAGRYAQALDVDPAPRRVRRTGDGGGWTLSELRLTSAGGVEVGAYVHEPPDGVDRVVVDLPGYGQVDGPFDPWRSPGTAELTLVPRGMAPLSVQPDVPDVVAEHVLHGIASRETYIIGGCVQGVWAAVSAAHALYPDLRRIDIHGVSFGGGLAALALAQERRVTAAVLKVPTFGNHPARLRTPCTGSGEAVRLLAQRDPSVAGVLAWFDAATAAARVRAPVLVGAARVDPAVPPVGQFAIFEALAGPRLLVELSAGHQEFDGEQLEYDTFRAASAAWLGMDVP